MAANTKFLTVTFLIFAVLFLGGKMPNKDERGEQRTVLKFLVKSGLSPTQSWTRMHEVFGANSISKNTIRLWHRRFSSGENSTADKPRPGRLKSARSADNIAAVSTHLTQDRRQTVCDIAQDLQMTKSSVHTILKKDLKMSKLAPKFVPKVLTDEQKCARKDWSEQNLQLLWDTDNLMDLVITGDETWVSIFELETKVASKEWHPKGSRADHPRKALRQRGERKAMLTVFFDVRGVVMAEFAAPGTTITADSYRETLETLKTRIRRKRKDLWAMQDDGWRAMFLHHDNAPSHTAIPALSFMGENQIQMLAHPPYSPDWRRVIFFCFLISKTASEEPDFQIWMP